MQSTPRIDELRQKFHENPRRYFAPLANEYRKAGDPEQAIAICRAHLAQQPGHMSGHVVYGQALYDAGRIDEARDVFQQALALDPENLIVLRHLGDIARRRGDTAEARSWYSRALDGDPQDAEVAAYLAELTEPLTVSEPSESPPSAPEPEREAATVPATDSEVPVATIAEPEVAEGVADSEVAAAPEVMPEVAEMESTSDDMDHDVVAPDSTEGELGEESMYGDFSFVDESEVSPAPSPYADTMRSGQASDESTPPPLEDSPYLEEVGSMDVAAEASPSAEVESQDSSEEIAATEEIGAADMETEGSPVPATEELQVPRSEDRSRFTPEFERTPIVTRTLAELYLQQGYIESALEIYRQLAEREPDDASLRQRITELSGLGIGAVSEWEEAGERATETAESAESESETEADVDETSEDEAEFDIGPMMPGEESAAAAEVSELGGSSELWDTADSWSTGLFDESEESDEIFALSAGADLPASEPLSPYHEDISETEEAVPVAQDLDVPSEPASPEAPSAKTPPADVPPEEELEEVPASVAVAHTRITIREFFATLGEIRPPTSPAGGYADIASPDDAADEPGEEVAAEFETAPSDSTTEPETYPYADDAFATLFENEPVDPEDSRAAAALSGAVAHSAPRSPLETAREPGQSRDQDAARESDEPAQESEEDIRRFREWLEGLANS